MRHFERFLCAALILFVVAVYPASANVTGPCANCHTMHNSQNGSSVVRDGSLVGWDSSGRLSGGSIQDAPMKNLLVTGCVGCHTSTTGETIVTIGGSRIPIVFNTTAYPVKPLAGGNFYYTSLGGDANHAKGHNVFGIAGKDALAEAPGRQSGTCSNSTSCHVTLAVPADTDGTFHTGANNGCGGCHVQVAHHRDSKPWYRFLKGHLDSIDYVEGVEDPDWEQNGDQSHHNWYKGHLGPVEGSDTIEDTHSINSYCGGCHGIFHREGTIRSSGSWIRHPSDIILPETGEYGGYNPATTYSVQAPVAWTNPASPTRATAVVMCLSCHRVHGSPYNDILRWDYGTMLAGGSNSGGCFTCHTQKRQSP
ncbi:MAG TPA: cytochrome c3 family protein [Thermodesulfovibrionales bacterium]|nr:cytochrome c3 family protein [Thermodesulfovibrionales bacterium]